MTTATHTLDKKALLNGEILNFNNETFCEATQSDDFRTAKVSFEDNANSWATGFKIWFNGELIHSSKTFAALQNRFNKLAEKWNLEPATDNE